MLCKSLCGPQTKKFGDPCLGYWKSEHRLPYWRLLLKNWVWQRHGFRRNESLAMQANCTARNAPIFPCESLLFSCLWEWIYNWTWI